MKAVLGEIYSGSVVQGGLERKRQEASEIDGKRHCAKDNLGGWRLQMDFILQLTRFFLKVNGSHQKNGKIMMIIIIVMKVFPDEIH